MIFSPLERMIAWRYLRSRRKEGFVSIITAFSLAGIALGVAALIVITSVMNGVKTEMLKHFIGLSGHVTVYSRSGGIEDYAALIEKIKTEKGVKNATAVVEGQAMASAHNRALGVQVMAMKYEDFAQKPDIAGNITAGNLESFKAGETLIMGERLAANLGITIGDSVTLISPEGRQTLAGMIPRIKNYTVAATFKLGMNTLDSGLIFMPFAEAQTYFKLSDGGHDKASSLQIMIDNPDHAPLIAKNIREMLGNDFVTYDWQQSNKSIFEALNVQRNVMFIILTLIIIVAAFNIISSLIMLVKDKGRDIAIMRTMGASRSSITRIFFASGAMIGIAGTGIGVVCGLLLAVNVDNIRILIEKASGGKIIAEQLYFLSTLPAEINPMQVLMVIIMSLSLSFLATLYPARKAAALNPAEALRYE